MRSSISMETKSAVMMRVHTIYLLRKLGEPVFVKFLLFLVLMFAFVSIVSVPSVVANILNSIQSNGSILHFVTTAFAESLLVVKLIIMVELVVAVALLRETLGRLPFLQTS